MTKRTFVVLVIILILNAIAAVGNLQLYWRVKRLESVTKTIEQNK